MKPQKIGFIATLLNLKPSSLVLLYFALSLSVSKIKENEIQLLKYENGRKVHTIAQIFRSIPILWHLTKVLFGKIK